MITVSDVKTLFEFSLEDTQIEPHLKRAHSDFKGVEFDAETSDEIEAVGCKTIYYLAPLIWVAMSGKAREFAESIETFKDIERFQTYWLNRSESIRDRYKKSNESTGSIGWMDI